MPPGQYRLDGTLTIPVGVTLEGVWQGPHTSHLDKGSVLLAYAGRDAEDSAPLISLQTSSTLKGLTIFYPEQNSRDIHPYPWTIQGRGQHYNVIDCTLVNSWNGVDCGSFHNEGHHLRNVYMCALNKGVYVDQCTDIGRIENVHIHNVYWWRVSAPYTFTPEQIEELNAWTPKHLTGFIIGRTDWEYMSGCFVIWAKVGFHFIKTDTRVGGTGNMVITQSGADIGPLAVKVDEVQSHAGIAFENCQFMSGIETSPDNSGPVKFSNCGFWYESGSGSHAVLNGSGTVFFSTCHFINWAKTKPCIEANAGSVIVQGCDFMDEAPVAHLGPNLTSAVFMGNRFRYGETITNESTGQVQLLGNVTE